LIEAYYLRSFLRGYLSKYVPFKFLKDNLIRRGVAPIDSLVCLGGCGKEEFINHIFLECDFFSSNWLHILQWLGICSVLPYDVRMYALQFGG